MKVTSSYIFLDEVRIHANHGVLPQENEVGQDFLVSARCGVDISPAMEHDMLEVALDYGTLYRLIEREMAKTSQLIEHVAGRIAQCVFSEFPMVTSLDLTIAKLNPPMGGDCKGAGVELHLINDKTGM
jgi:dihydroneopterin aldolase